MARLTPGQWQAIRTEYEVDCISSTKLSNKYGVAESTICRRMKKEGWDRNKTQDAIEKKVSSIKALAEITQVNASGTQAILQEAERRLRLEGFFMDALEYNQTVANNTLKRNIDDGSAELTHINLHSQITNRNKDGVMGKPQTQVNIQNNVAVNRESIMEDLMQEYGR